jgi:hypothetical protein
MNNIMTKEQYTKLFIDAIKKSDEALDGEIEIKVETIETKEDYDYDINEEELGIYFEYRYQIDDRIERMDEDVVTKMEKILGPDYGISISRLDAYSNGYAYYSITIDK